MVEIEFYYNQQTVIQTKLDEPFKNAINKYLQKSLLDSNNAFFIANGRQINPEEKVENQISLSNIENKKVKILVQLIEKKTIVQEYAKSKDIICPQCYETCRIKTENYHIALFGCMNNHTTIIRRTDIIKRLWQESKFQVPFLYIYLWLLFQEHILRIPKQYQ